MELLRGTDPATATPFWISCGTPQTAAAHHANLYLPALYFHLHCPNWIEVYSKINSWVNISDPSSVKAVLCSPVFRQIIGQDTVAYAGLFQFGNVLFRLLEMSAFLAVFPVLIRVTSNYLSTFSPAAFSLSRHNYVQHSPSVLWEWKHTINNVVNIVSIHVHL